MSRISAMRSKVVRCWWLLTAAATLSIFLVCPSHASFLEDPELRALGLGFKVLPPLSLVAAVGKPATIPCQPIETEQGSARVTWIKNAVALNDSRRHVLPNGTLLITRAEENDRGLYSCVLTAGNYSVSSPFVYLIFAVTGVWQLKPRNNTVEEGRAVRLTCHMASLPEASSTWLKDNETLPENETRYYQPNPGVLQITNVKPQDEGMFRCKAVNQLLKQEFLSPGGYLAVIPHHKDDGSSGTGSHPSLLAVPSKVEVHEGERAVLECISDEEELLLEWSRLDEMPIPENRTMRMGQGSLVFPSVMQEDTNVYNCTALNKKRETIMTQMIELSVMTPPRVQLSMTVSKRPTSKISVISNGQSVRISCATWGTPRPTISWFKDGVLHVESGRHTYTNRNSTRIYNSEDLFIGIIMFKDMGVYQCVTRNRAGVASDGFILKIHMSNNLPKPPVNIEVGEVNPHSIRLSWDPPLESSVSGYIINIVQNKSQSESQTIAKKTSIKMKELRPSTNYTIYIRSFLIYNVSNIPLIGEPSDYISIKTKAEYYRPDPTKMPKVMLYPKSPTELFVNWSLAEYRNRDPIIQQKIQWKKKRKHYHNEYILPANVTEQTINKLSPSQVYSVRVLVSTSAGYPQHSIQLPWFTVKMPRDDFDVQHDRAFLTVHLSTYSEKPTEILVNWTLDAALQNEISTYCVFCNNSVSSCQHDLGATDSSLVLTDLDPETCYAVTVQATFHNNRNSTKSPLRTLCTLPPSPFMHSQQSNTNKIKVKRLRAKLLNTTSVLITWKHTSRKLLVNFYTIKIKNIKSHWDSLGVIGEQIPEVKTGVAVESSEKDTHSPQTTNHEEDTSALHGQVSGFKVPARQEVRFYRVTSQRFTVTNLEPLHNYSITVTASTTTFTGPPSVTFVTPDEGVPSPPLNVTWVPVSPKDATLTWSPPRLVNGHLLSYLVAFSHDEQEWRNKTIDPYHTTTKIQDLVSNTNYTLYIAGVTGKGVGASTTVFIYIWATLECEPQITTELVVISVVSLLAVVTCVVAVLLCFRILRLRHNSPSVFQADGTIKGMEPLQDSLNHYRMLGTLDDIDDADDTSRRLLQCVSTTQPVFSKSMKEFDPRPMYNSTQVDHHSSTEGAGSKPAISS